MKKILLIISLLLLCVSVVVCSEKNDSIGEFFLGNIGFDFQNNKTYYLVVPIEWTGESPVTIKSIELTKRDEKSITNDNDGIKYEFFGADPLKKSGIYSESDIGDIKSIENFKIKGKGKIVIKLSMKDVKKDSERRAIKLFKSTKYSHHYIHNHCIYF